VGQTWLSQPVGSKTGSRQAHRCKSEGANLLGADLRSADPSGGICADLSGANLSGTNLMEPI